MAASPDPGQEYGALDGSTFTATCGKWVNNGDMPSFTDLCKPPGIPCIQSVNTQSKVVCPTFSTLIPHNLIGERGSAAAITYHVDIVVHLGSGGYQALSLLAIMGSGGLKRHPVKPFFLIPGRLGLFLHSAPHMVAANQGCSCNLRD